MLTQKFSLFRNIKNFPRKSAGTMIPRTRTWRNLWTTLAACVMACTAFGCNFLISQSKSDSFSDRLLNPVVAPRDAIEIEVYYVDRRFGDSFIGDHLWSSLHSVHAIDTKSAAHLNDDGFLVGMSASRPPRELSVLMSDSDEKDPTRRRWMQKYTIPAGQEMMLVASAIPDGTVIQRKTSDGEASPIELVLARSVFKVRAEKVEDGWTRLVIIPEIQYGRNAARAVATERDWIYQDRQQALTLYEDRITAELNEQEILVIGMQQVDESRIARHFFSADPGNGLQRLMMIRISGMTKIEPERQNFQTQRLN